MKPKKIEKIWPYKNTKQSNICILISLCLLEPSLLLITCFVRTRPVRPTYPMVLMVERLLKWNSSWADVVVSKCVSFSPTLVWWMYGSSSMKGVMQESYSFEKKVTLLGSNWVSSMLQAVIHTNDSSSLISPMRTLRWKNLLASLMHIMTTTSGRIPRTIQQMYKASSMLFQKCKKMKVWSRNV